MAIRLRQPKQATDAEITPFPVQAAPPTPTEAIDAKIAGVVEEQIHLNAELKRIKDAIADAWGDLERRTELARQAGGIHELLQASNDVIERYQHERRHAVKAEIIAAFKADVDRYAALAAELRPFEAGEWVKIEEAYNEGMLKRRTLRAQLAQIQIQSPHEQQLATIAQFQGDPAILAEIGAAKEAITRAVPEWHTIWKKV